MVAYLVPARVINRPKQHLDGFSRFRMGPKCYAVKCIVKTPQKIAPSPWEFVTPQEKDRATAIDNMHKNW